MCILKYNKYYVKRIHTFKTTQTFSLTPFFREGLSCTLPQVLVLSYKQMNWLHQVKALSQVWLLFVYKQWSALIKGVQQQQLSLVDGTNRLIPCSHINRMIWLGVLKAHIHNRRYTTQHKIINTILTWLHGQRCSI